MNRKVIIVCVIGALFLLLLAGIWTINVKNKQSTEIAKQSSIKITNKIESTYSDFNAYIDSAEQAKLQASIKERILTGVIIHTESKIDELKENLEKEYRLRKKRENEISALRDSVARIRVKYSTDN